MIIPRFRFHRSSTSPSENAGTVTITATQSVVAAEETTVTLATSGTATNGSNKDYTINSSTIKIPAGQTSGTATLTIINDSIPESSETIVLDISSVSGGNGAYENGTQRATLTINNDDHPKISISSSSTSPSENIGHCNDHCYPKCGSCRGNDSHFGHFRYSKKWKWPGLHNQ